MSNVLNPEGIDITLNSMIISQIQILVERYLIHRLRINDKHLGVTDGETVWDKKVRKTGDRQNQIIGIWELLMEKRLEIKKCEKW